VPETWTEDPRAVATYDVECAGRWDHDFYLALAGDLGARAVVDVGCGTGVFCVDLARRGIHAVGVDPAAAMIDAARARPGGDLPTWVHGTVADLGSGTADLVVMMGHVAQYFLTDEDWDRTLVECRRVLRDGGRLTFETRNPDRDWPHRWTPERTLASYPHPDGGQFSTWVEVTEVLGPPTSFVQTHIGHTALPDGARLHHAETLRFRSEQEVRASLEQAGFAVEQIWGGWDRTPVAPGSDELIVLAR
jgi:SAM-dependent methyltransferase